MEFSSKDRARDWVWTRMEESGVARFPFPPRGRIPNFEGSDEAARRLLDDPLLAGVEVIKVNPDAPQRYVRAGALERGIAVLVPTPRLRGGFKLLDPEAIPAEERRSAASLSKMDAWARRVPLAELPPVDLVVTGSVAVTRRGRRCGKGEGYSDLEYAILRELGHPDVPVITTVHPIQVVESVPRDAHDLVLARVFTPEETVRIDDPPPPPAGVDWNMIDEEDLGEMPVLEELRGR